MDKGGFRLQRLASGDLGFRVFGFEAWACLGLLGLASAVFHEYKHMCLHVPASACEEAT